MTAAAVAARVADELTSRPEPGATAAAGLAVIVAGGLVEGSALGWAQGTQLRRRLPDLDLRRFFWATVVVAGLGWAVASAPAALDPGGEAGSSPPLALVLLGAAGIGLFMGSVLGGCQAMALRGVAESPGRWLRANAVAWPAAMVVIFLGATTAEASWSLGGVAAYGAITGAVAGSLLGLGTAPFVPAARHGRRRWRSRRLGDLRPQGRRPTTRGKSPVREEPGGGSRRGADHAGT